MAASSTNFLRCHMENLHRQMSIPSERGSWRKIDPLHCHGAGHSPREEPEHHVCQNRGVERGTLNVFGRVTTTSGWVVETFEDTVEVDVPHEMLRKAMLNAASYQRVITLRPGQYCLTNIVVRDVNGDRVGTWRSGVQLPEYNEGEMATSSLILINLG
jgi:hypothetical protein